MSLEAELAKRAENKCELCEGDKDLEVLVLKKDSLNFSLLICSDCRISSLDPINNQDKLKFLNTSIWSEVEAVQAISYRILKELAGINWALSLSLLNTQDRILKELAGINWATSLLDQVYYEDEVIELALSEKEEAVKTLKVLDSNGIELQDGDSVTLIKDLVVKGANFTAKRGTLVKNIYLNGNQDQIEGKVNGTKIVLLTKFLKKV